MANSSSNNESNVVLLESSKFRGFKHRIFLNILVNLVFLGLGSTVSFFYFRPPAEANLFEVQKRIAAHLNLGPYKLSELRSKICSPADCDLCGKQTVSDLIELALTDLIRRELAAQKPGAGFVLTKKGREFVAEINIREYLQAKDNADDPKNIESPGIPDGTK